MLCHFLNKGILPEEIINRPFAEKMFFKASYEIDIEEETKKYKALVGGGS